MHVPKNVKTPNNISEWQMGFNSPFKGLTYQNPKGHKACSGITLPLLETERPPCISCNKCEKNKYCAPPIFSLVRREKEYKFLSHKLHQHVVTHFSSGISSYQQPLLVYQNVDQHSHHIAYRTKFVTVLFSQQTLQVLCYSMIVKYSSFYFHTVSNGRSEKL